MKKVLAIILVLILSVSFFAGCGKEDKTNSSGKVVIEVGGWPKENETEKLATYNKLREEFMAANPDIEIVPVSWFYDVKAYLPQAASGQIPTLYDIYFTEVDRVINAGFAKNVTKQAKEFGWYDTYSDQIKELVLRNDELFFLPVSCYSMGLQINKRVFEKAGLVNEDGTVMIPETYDEVVEFSKIIKEKTGAHGFMMTTKGNGGGWHFLNLAWSFGTEFMKQENGEWKATFNSEECAAALQYLSDLKWKHNITPVDAIIGSDDINQLFANDKLAMTYATPTAAGVVEKMKFNKDDLVFASMPGGPGGRYTQMGGTLKVIDRNATEEQVEACFKWLEFMGNGPHLTEDSRNSIISDYDTKLKEDRIVGVKPLSVWNENSEVNKFISDVIDEKANVDIRNFEHYALTKATLRPEEPVNCQELYQVMSGCMQEVLTNKNADIEKTLKDAAADFQANSLNNAK